MEIRHFDIAKKDNVRKFHTVGHISPQNGCFSLIKIQSVFWTPLYDRYKFYAQLGLAWFHNLTAQILLFQRDKCTKTYGRGGGEETR